MLSNPVIMLLVLKYALFLIKTLSFVLLNNTFLRKGKNGSDAQSIKFSNYQGTEAIQQILVKRVIRNTAKTYTYHLYSVSTFIHHAYISYIGDTNHANLLINYTLVIQCRMNHKNYITCVYVTNINSFWSIWRTHFSVTLDIITATFDYQLCGVLRVARACAVV